MDWNNLNEWSPVGLALAGLALWATIHFVHAAASAMKHVVWMALYGALIWGLYTYIQTPLHDTLPPWETVQVWINATKPFIMNWWYGAPQEDEPLAPN